MITKLQRAFKMATVKRKRLRHKEELLLQKVEKFIEKINNETLRIIEL